MRLGPNVVRLGMMLAVVGGFPVLLALLLSEIGGDAQPPGGPAISEITIGEIAVSGGGTSIDYEPISLDHAHSLIDSGQVRRIAIRPERNVDEFWLELYEGSETPAPRFEPSRRWEVTGLEVVLFTESMPHGVPILSDDENEVGITSEQFDDLIERIKQHNRTESSPIELLDQRGGSDSLTIPR